jgi:hypothetical protein
MKRFHRRHSVIGDALRAIFIASAAVAVADLVVWVVG